MIDGLMIDAVLKLGFPTAIATVLIVYLVRNVTSALREIAESYKTQQAAVEEKLMKLAVAQEAANYFLRVLVWRHGLGPNPADDIPPSLQETIPGPGGGAGSSPQKEQAA